MPGEPVRTLAGEAPEGPDGLVAGLLGAFAMGLLRVEVREGGVKLYTVQAKPAAMSNRSQTTTDVLAGTPGSALARELPSDPVEALRVLAAEKVATNWR